MGEISVPVDNNCNTTPISRRASKEIRHLIRQLSRPLLPSESSIHQIIESIINQIGGADDKIKMKIRLILWTKMKISVESCFSQQFVDDQEDLESCTGSDPLEMNISPSQDPDKHSLEKESASKDQKNPGHLNLKTLKIRFTCGEVEEATPTVTGASPRHAKKNEKPKMRYHVPETTRLLGREPNISIEFENKHPTSAESAQPMKTMTVKHLRHHMDQIKCEFQFSKFRRCLLLINKIMEHQKNRRGQFNFAVDPVALNIPQYTTIITSPMDLGTVKRNLEEATYSSLNEFADDVVLVFDNAMKFNPESHYIHQDAKDLKNVFLDQYRQTQDKILAESKQDAAHSCYICIGNTCPICGQKCLDLNHRQMACSGTCEQNIRRGSVYFITPDGTRAWCSRCVNKGGKKGSSRSSFSNLSSVLDTSGAAGDYHSSSNIDGHAQSSVGDSPASTFTPLRIHQEPTLSDVQQTLLKRRCEAEPEPWVKCDQCSQWVHQICGLFNPIEDYVSTAKSYVCPLCICKEKEIKEVGQGQSSSSRTIDGDDEEEHSTMMETEEQIENEVVKVEETDQAAEKIMGYMDAFSLPTCHMSDHLEQFLKEKLEAVGKSREGETLCIRVVSSSSKHQQIPEQLSSLFTPGTSYSSTHPNQHYYPKEVSYTSKAIYLFQQSSASAGLDVCLFGMYVQEYDDTCELLSNRRKVYIAYLDSVRYLYPATIRTSVYHYILLGYLDYVRKRGFHHAHIWSCPPQRSVSYIFWYHPLTQRTPNAEHLRQWYQKMLELAKEHQVIANWTTFYERYFEPKAKSPEVKSESEDPTLKHEANGDSSDEEGWPMAEIPPCFEGDIWPAEADRLIRLKVKLAKESKKTFHKKSKSKSKSKKSKTSSGLPSLRTSSTAAAVAAAAAASSTTIMDIRSSNYGIGCDIFASPSTFSYHNYKAQLESKQSAHQPITNYLSVREFFDAATTSIKAFQHDILVVDLIPLSDARGKTSKSYSMPVDPDVDVNDKSRFIATRHAFYQLCAHSSYQFDSLRRVKHTTMMVLYHLVNPSLEQKHAFCDGCALLITRERYWHCQECENFAFCDWCQSTRSHPHKLYQDREDTQVKALLKCA